MKMTKMLTLGLIALVGILSAEQAFAFFGLFDDNDRHRHSRHRYWGGPYGYGGPYGWGGGPYGWGGGPYGWGGGPYGWGGGPYGWGNPYYQQNNQKNEPPPPPPLPN